MQEQGGVSEVHVVEAWHAALNEGDMDRLVGLSHPDVEFGGPRGVGQGVQLLRVGGQGERPPRPPTRVQTQEHGGRGADRAVAIGGVGGGDRKPNCGFGVRRVRRAGDEPGALR